MVSYVEVRQCLMLKILSYYSSDPKPTDLLMKMVDNAISKDLLKPAVDEFVNTIKCQYPELIKSAIVDTFTNLFFTELKSAVLKDAIYQMIKTS